MLTPSAHAGVGDYFSTDHGAFRVIEQPDHLTLAPNESIEATITLGISSQLYIKIHPTDTQPRICGEQLATGLLGKILTNNPDILVTTLMVQQEDSRGTGGSGTGCSAGTCDTDSTTDTGSPDTDGTNAVGHPDPETTVIDPPQSEVRFCETFDEQDYEHVRSYTVYITATEAFDGGDFTLFVDFRMFDLGTPATCNPINTGFRSAWGGGIINPNPDNDPTLYPQDPLMGPFDSGHWTTEIGGNGAIAAHDGETSSTSYQDPATTTFEDGVNCVHENICIEFDDCLVPSGGCWVFNDDPWTYCPACDFSKANPGIETVLAEVDVYDHCPVPCAEGLIAGAGGCVCPSGLPVDASGACPSVCPTSGARSAGAGSGTCCPQGQTPVDGVCMCDDGSEPDGDGKCEVCPELLEWTIPKPKTGTQPLVPFERNDHGRLKPWQQDTCDDPMRPKYASSTLGPIENIGDFYLSCPQTRIDILHDYPQFAPTLQFEDATTAAANLPEKETLAECKYKLKKHWDNDGRDSHESSGAKVKYKPRRGDIDGTVDFTKFKLWGNDKARVDTSRTKLLVELKTKKEGGRFESEGVERVEFCGIPTGVHYTPRADTEGAVLYDISLLPSDVTYYGRAIQEFIQHEENTCTPLWTSDDPSKPGLLDRINANFLAKVHKEWACTDAWVPEYWRTKYCDDGMLSDHEIAEIDNIVDDQRKKLNRCFIPISGTGKPFFTYGAGRFSDTIGMVPHNPVDGSPIFNDTFCARALGQLLHEQPEGARRCDVGVGQYFRISCDKDRTDGGTYQNQTAKTAVFAAHSLILTFRPNHLKVKVGTQPPSQGDRINRSSFASGKEPIMLLWRAPTEASP